MAQKTAAKAKTRFKPSKELLHKQINLPVKGALGKNVHAPKWLQAFGGYFVGAWQELRQVSWPTRRASWGLTIAVLCFTFFLAAFILAVDSGFEQLFKGVFIK